MEIFERLAGGDYEQNVFCQDRPTGLRAIVAIHSTSPEPALGGTHCYPYRSDDETDSAAGVTDIVGAARALLDH